MANIKLCIQNLGKYNEGILDFKWVDLPVDDDFASVFDEIEVCHDDVVYTDEFGSPYEEWMIADYETDFDMEIGEYDNIFELNELAEELEDFTEQDLDVYKSAVEVYGSHYIDIRDFDPNDYILMYDVSDETELGERFAEEVYGSEEAFIDNLSDFEEYFDYEKFGRNFNINFSIYEWADEEDEDFDENMDAYDYFGVYNDYDLGYEVIEQFYEGNPKLIDNPEYYIDYEKFGRELTFEQDGGFCKLGYIYR